MFRLGDSLAVRLPRTASAVRFLLAETRWVPELGANWDFPYPEFPFVGEPGEGYPWPWAIVSWLPGDMAVDVPLLASEGPTLGRALAQVHALAPRRGAAQRGAVDPDARARGEDAAAGGAAVTTGRARRASGSTLARRSRCGPRRVALPDPSARGVRVVACRPARRQRVVARGALWRHRRLGVDGRVRPGRGSWVRVLAHAGRRRGTRCWPSTGG